MSNLRLTKASVLLISFLFFGLFWFSACEEEKVITETETVTVTVRDTITVSIISVDSIFIEPDGITEGASVDLSANYTANGTIGTATYQWFASAGTLSAPEGETVTWKAPDDPGAYTITVHVTDGEFIGVGSRLVGVGMYAPTASPYFLGDQACAGCHADYHAEWEETAHAHAWETLQNSGHPAAYCNPCHTIGYEPAPLDGNSGYDEVPIAKFVNVQCENCHGPASEHVGSGTPDPTKIVVSFDVMTCGKCHDGTHHPYLSDWLTSPHNVDVTGVASRAGCNGCHEGAGAAYRLSGDLSVYYGSGEVTARPDTSVIPVQPLNCITCHDPHNDTNPGQLRTIADVPLVESAGESPVITLGGTGKICMHCHHSRRAPDEQVAVGYARFGSHYSPQADIMAGKSGYQGVADPGFVWATPSHLNVQNSCKTCHLNMVEFVSNEEPAITGHSFWPTVAACANCHGVISDFDEIPALDDFDGDGVVEGVQSEVAGLMHLLEEALLADGLDTTGEGFAGALGDSSISTFKQRESGFNLIYLEEDGSHGVHNPDYYVQLLQQSIQHLTGQPVPNAVML
jgi:hypothetical protein